MPLSRPRARGPGPTGGRRRPGRAAARGSRAGGGDPGVASSAASGVTQATTEVANDLPRNGPSGTYSQRLDVARRPVVDQARPRTRARRTPSAGDRRAQSRGRADHEADLGLDVEPRDWAERRSRRRRLALAVRPARRRCRRRPPCRPGRGSRSAGASSWAVSGSPSGRKIRPTFVGVVLGGVEVDVVGDRERQVQRHARSSGTQQRLDGARGAPGSVSQSVIAARTAVQTARAGGQQRVQRAAGERGAGSVRRAVRAAARSSTRSPMATDQARRRRRACWSAVGQVVHAEQVVVRDAVEPTPVTATNRPAAGRSSRLGDAARAERGEAAAQAGSSADAVRGQRGRHRGRPGSVGPARCRLARSRAGLGGPARARCSGSRGARSRCRVGVRGPRCAGRRCT